jgi:hypothetical protein
MPILRSKRQLKHSLTPCLQRLNGNGKAGETNRTQDAGRVEALRDLRGGLGTPLAIERERSEGKDCAICNEIWVSSEVLSQGTVRHLRQMASAKWQMIMPLPMSSAIPAYVYKVRPHKDHRGFDLISDVLPFSRPWYVGPDAVSNAIGYAKLRSRSHDAVIRVYDETGNVVETHELTGDFKAW